MPLDHNLKLSGDWILKRSHFSAYKTLERPEFKSLVAEDMSLEALEAELEGMRSKFKGEVLDWRSSLEQALIKCLQEANNSEHEEVLVSAAGDPQALGDNLPRFTLSLGSGSPIRPINVLPAETQQLLRADSVFAFDSHPYFYPDDFEHEESYGTFDTNLVKFAKALLSALGRPDATYLELKAVGKAFLCGRCHSTRGCMTWKEMVRNYSIFL